jgi:phosphatidylglycerol:prolipoprotein diacylglycerol transferase
MINFLHNYTPSPVLINFGLVEVYWYGLIMVVSMALAMMLAARLAKFFDIKTDDLYDLAFWLIIWGLVGARLYHIGLDWSYYSQYPEEMPKIWHGGLAIHGAVLAGLAVTLWWSRVKKWSFWRLAGVLAPALALGQALGRWGNYFNQELFGKPTNLPWGIMIEVGRRPLGYEEFSYFQPTFLYESIASLALAGALIYLIKNSEQVARERLGQRVLGIYLIVFGLYRGLVEFIKIDLTPVAWGLRWPQWMSLILIVFGGIICYKSVTIKK